MIKRIQYIIAFSLGILILFALVACDNNGNDYLCQSDFFEDKFTFVRLDYWSLDDDPITGQPVTGLVAIVNVRYYPKMFFVG